MKHEAWLWIWFYLGMGTYWLKRAYYGINPPNPVATGWKNYIERAWAPLLVRAFLESLVFWILFTPGIADKLLASLGWESYGWAVALVTQVAPITAVFGHTMDSIADMAVSKIPFLNNVVPQMPGPLPQKAIVEASIVKQTTEVTQLQSTTTTVPQDK